MRSVVFVLLLAVPALSPAQNRTRSPYLDRYDELTRIQPVGARVADVSNLVLERDAGRLTLTSGKLFMLSPVDGRTVGAIFRGEGRFRFTPSLPMEAAELRRVLGAPALDEAITEAILLFSDSTLAQIERLTFTTQFVPSEVNEHVRDAIGTLKRFRDDAFNPDVMEPILNGGATPSFLAHLLRARGDPLLFQVYGGWSEAVQLSQPVSRRQYGARWAPVVRFPAGGPAAPPAGTWSERDRLAIPAIRGDVRLTTVSADLQLAGAITMTLVAREAVGPWLYFWLDGRLDLDSARWGTGEAADGFKADDDAVLWVRAPRRLAPGDSMSLTVHYHGLFAERFDDWFFINPGAPWYPLNGQGDDLARFELTFRSPSHLPLVSTGVQRDSSAAANVMTTRWVTEIATPRAMFNLGQFDIRRVQNPGAPALTILLSEHAHMILATALRRRGIVIPEQRNMSQVVGAEMSNALTLFGSLYGESQYRHFYVSEIPFDEGVSFPGMIVLSYGTFGNTSLDGFDEFFRAHEAAHQWWGNGVRPASYRDAWLSEGLATFSGLWYLQAARRRNDEYNRFLDRYRDNILAIKDRVGPTALGWRAASVETPSGYQTMIYEKGAWIFHMLRVMMMDLSTLRSNRINETLNEYHTTFRGGTASTDDFRALAEQRLGPLGWFFDQWVRGTAIPTYHVSWTAQPDTTAGRFRVRFRIRQEGVPADFRMPVLVAANLGGDRIARFRVTVSGAQTEYLSPALPAEPREVVFNEFRSVLATVEMERWRN